MKILVDADACPVKEIIVELAKKNNIEVIMFCDTSHVLYDGYSKIIVVDKARDAVDIALVNNIANGDIVVSQDYGVAAMALAKGAQTLNQNGFLYTNNNIDVILFDRYVANKVRRSGGRTKGPAKRTKNNDEKFREVLTNILGKCN